VGKLESPRNLKIKQNTKLIFRNEWKPNEQGLLGVVSNTFARPARIKNMLTRPA
jgi:hypothetical protein